MDIIVLLKIGVIGQFKNENCPEESQALGG